MPPPVAVVVFIMETGQAWDRTIMAPGSWSPLTRSGPDCVGRQECLPHLGEGSFGAGNQRIEGVSHVGVGPYHPGPATGPGQVLSRLSVVMRFRDVFRQAE